MCDSFMTTAAAGAELSAGRQGMKIMFQMMNEAHRVSGRRHRIESVSARVNYAKTRTVVKT